MKSLAPRRVPFLYLAAGWVTVLGSLLGAPTAHAQLEPPPFGQGTHALRRILHDLDLQPLDGVMELARQPEKKLLIVLGDIGILERMPFRFEPTTSFIEGFLRHGGAVLIATDRTHGWWWKDRETFRIDQLLRIDPDSPHALRRHSDCIEVLPTGRQRQLFPKPGQPPVWSNRPASLAEWPEGLSLLATLPEECRNIRPFSVNRRPLVFAVGGDWGPGRILVLADHSVFINDMMLQPDTGNIDFTYNCVQWLTNNGKRTQVLFVEEGVPQASFDVPVKHLPPPPLPPPEVMVPLINEALKNLEEENVFNQVALNVIDSMLARYFGDLLGPGQFLEALALLLTMSLISFGISRLLRARHRLEIGTPLLDNALARLTPSGALVEQRRQALLQSGNLWESARVLARQCFESVLDVQAVADQRGPGGAGPLPPRMRVLAGWWRRLQLQQSWERLWHLAYGSLPTRVSPRHWAQLLRQLDDVEAALAEGIIQLESRESPEDERSRGRSSRLV